MNSLHQAYSYALTVYNRIPIVFICSPTLRKVITFRAIQRREIATVSDMSKYKLRIDRRNHGDFLELEFYFYIFRFKIEHWMSIVHFAIMCIHIRITIAIIQYQILLIDFCRYDQRTCSSG